MLVKPRASVLGKKYLVLSNIQEFLKTFSLHFVEKNLRATLITELPLKEMTPPPPDQYFFINNLGRKSSIVIKGKALDALRTDHRKTDEIHYAQDRMIPDIQQFFASWFSWVPSALCNRRYLVDVLALIPRPLRYDAQVLMLIEALPLIDLLEFPYQLLTLRACLHGGRAMDRRVTYPSSPCKQAGPKRGSPIIISSVTPFRILHRITFNHIKSQQRSL